MTPAAALKPSTVQRGHSYAGVFAMFLSLWRFVACLLIAAQGLLTDCPPAFTFDAGAVRAEVEAAR